MIKDQLLAGLGRTFDTHEHFGYFSEYSPSNSTLTLKDVINGSYMATGNVPADDYDAICTNLAHLVGSSRFESLRGAFRHLYDVDMYPLSPAKMRAIDEKIRAGTGASNHPFTMLKEHGNVDKILMDIPSDKRVRWEHPDAMFTIRLDEEIFPFIADRPGIYRVSKAVTKVESFAKARGMALGTLEAFDDAVEQYLASLRPITTAVKIGTAYQRTNHFLLEENDDGAIAGIYKKIAAKEGRVTEHEMRRWGNYVATHLLGFAQVEKMPVQVHTGLASMAETSPMELLDIMEMFSAVTFDLFHGGYPFHHCVPGVLDKRSNARVDLCWMPVLSESATVELLTGLIEMGHAGKVLAYGGDCQCPHGSLGALLLAKELLAGVLARFIDKKRLTFEDALAMGDAMLWATPASVFLK